MRAFFHTSLAKFVAVTAAAACCGGGIVLGGGGGASGAAPVVLDHYLCTEHFGADSCGPTTVTLPDGTTFGINDPGAHLVCTYSHRRHGWHHDGTTSATISNEFTSTPVTLHDGHYESTSAIVEPVAPPTTAGAHVKPVRAATPADARFEVLESFSCSSVHYPFDATSKFTPPNPVTLNNGLSVNVFDPSRLCTPTDPTLAAGTNADLLCFQVQAAEPAPHHHHFHFHFVTSQLCVPSTNGTVTPPSSTTTIDPPSSTTSTSTSTTTTTVDPPSSTTTTTVGPPAPTTTTTTMPATTTTTTTTVAPTTTTTTGTPTSQPCPGVMVNGRCIVIS